MRRLVNGLVRDLARALGYTLIPNWRLLTYPQAAFLSRLLTSLKIDCVLDVGANCGQFRDFLRHNVEYTGLIVSFEPIPENAERLRHRAAADAQWKIVECALGSSHGVVPFNIMANTEFSSFLRPDHSHTARFSATNVISRTVEVETNTLEDLLPSLRSQLGFSSVYLKLDTQGFDLDVARGAGNALEMILALQTEASLTPIYYGMPAYHEAISGFQSLGFEVSGMFPNHPEQFPRLLEFDCHMVARRVVDRLP